MDAKWVPSLLERRSDPRRWMMVLWLLASPVFAAPPLWDAAQPVPKAKELQTIAGAEFHVIKPQRPDIDRCKYTLGVGLAWHKGN